jgi:hypothetical protein
MPASVHDPDQTNEAREDAVIHRISGPARQDPAEDWGHQGVGFGALTNPLKPFLQRLEKAARDVSGSGSILVGGHGTGSTR